MLKDLLIAPSVNSLFFTGFLLLTIFYIFFMNFNSIMRLDFYRKIILLSTLTIAIGIHGLIHLGVEDEYDFNPYKWF
jgi:hypothetical protein